MNASADGSVAEGRRILGECIGDHDAAARAIISGGPILDFTGGWAKLAFFGRLGHHWKPTPGVTVITEREDGRRMWHSACGGMQFTTDRTPAIRIGTWGHCKRCAKAVGRGPTDAECGL